jgi:hypothetical protein
VVIEVIESADERDKAILAVVPGALSHEAFTH